MDNIDIGCWIIWQFLGTRINHVPKCKVLLCVTCAFVCEFSEFMLATGFFYLFVMMIDLRWFSILFYSFCFVCYFIWLIFTFRRCFVPMIKRTLDVVSRDTHSDVRTIRGFSALNFVWCDRDDSSRDVVRGLQWRFTFDRVAPRVPDLFAYKLCHCTPKSCGPRPTVSIIIRLTRNLSNCQWLFKLAIGAIFSCHVSQVFDDDLTVGTL